MLQILLHGLSHSKGSWSHLHPGEVVLIWVNLINHLINLTLRSGVIRVPFSDTNSHQKSEFSLIKFVFFLLQISYLTMAENIFVLILYMYTFIMDVSEF